MNPTPLSRRRPLRRPPKPRACLQVEFLETRNLMAGALGLTALVQVSDPCPLAPPPAPPPVVFADSEVEPQIAVDPTNTAHAVAIWQQDRFRSVGGARALVVSVTTNANDTDTDGAEWSTPVAIPGFDATDPAGAAFPRYTDPWVSFAPNGDVYASACAITPAGPFPGHTAVLVSKSIDGGSTWSTPTTLIDYAAPPGTDPIDLANDKESVTADPTNSNYAYVVWDQLNHPGDQQNFNAFHGLCFREDAMFARTTDGGATWEPVQNLTNFQANVSAFGNQIVVEPDGTLLDVFTHLNGSGNQKAQAEQVRVGVMRSTDKGVTWSDIITGPAIESMDVTDPDTGAPVRAGEPLVSVTVDPASGNLYAVWPDGRFSGFAHDDIALSMSTDGGLTWSDPIKVNQTPTNVPAGNQQAFTPAVAVNSDGTVAVTYYDFRNNTAAAGLTTDYWLVHASGSFTDPASWATDEKRLTSEADGVTGKPFNLENAPPTSRGYFLGDYQGLAAAGTSFYALFGQAGADSSDPSNIWFRDPPPAPGSQAELENETGAAAPASVTPFSAFLADAKVDLRIGDFAGNIGGPDDAGRVTVSDRSAIVDPLAPTQDKVDPLMSLATSSADGLLGAGGMDSTSAGADLLDGVFSDGWETPSE